MLRQRTDLAAEARELWQERADKTTQLDGVAAQTETLHGCQVETLRILDRRGVEALGKPCGTYVTITLGPLMDRQEDAFSRCAALLAAQLRTLLRLHEGDSVLVAGLGNASITPDELGPAVIRHILPTRHLVETLPEQFGSFRRVSALETGVLGTTGVESAELISAVAQRIRPDAVIAVDALASRRMERVCRTVQLTDTGIVPGSGVGNRRAALNRSTLGVPVIAVGVPTVVDAGTLAADLTQMANLGSFDPDAFGEAGRSMIVTPREIDARIALLGKLLGCGLNLALHEGLSFEDLMMLTE